MNNRWTFQLVIGSAWATLSWLIMCLFYQAEGSLQEKWNSGELPVQIGLIYICGIFFFGWFMWRQRSKNEKKKLS